MCLHLVQWLTVKIVQLPQIPAKFAKVVFMRVKVDRRVMLASLIVRYAQTGLTAQNAKPTMHLVQEAVAPVVQVNIQMAQLLALHAD